MKLSQLRQKKYFMRTNQQFKINLIITQLIHMIMVIKIKKINLQIIVKKKNYQILKKKMKQNQKINFVNTKTDIQI